MLLWDAPIFSKVFLVCFLIALLLEFGLLLLASMFLPDFDFVTGSGYFFLGVGSFLFRIHFFILKQNSSSVLLVVLRLSSVIFASPLSVITVSAIYFSTQFIITFSYRLFLTVWYISPGFEFVSHVFVFTILKFSESIFMISFLDAFSQAKNVFSDVKVVQFLRFHCCVPLHHSHLFEIDEHFHSINLSGKVLDLLFH